MFSASFCRRLQRLLHPPH
ncbi:hypothetical protein E2C01_069360 [Portunus trituberculatus]|uniref:Uncharacterized protein n=1 Tax=Portunus trituberculatus TaxID=210409 RepID=A0A5B7I1Z2_PORTR|nr:hypothetical protein [Portunus trituberculatus]